MEIKKEESNLGKLVVLCFIIVLEAINLIFGFIAFSLIFLKQGNIYFIFIGIILLPIFFLITDRLTKSRSARINELKDAKVINNKIALLIRTMITAIIFFVISQFNI